MKINRIKSYNYKLVKLKLIKTKVYKKKLDHFIKIEDISNRLKKALHIIYKYHINNKKILFIGTPVNVDSKFQNMLKNTKHTLIPEALWMNGLITNQRSCFKYLSKNQKAINNKISKLLFKIKNKSDLIVVLNASNNSSALDEGYSARIPIISINYDVEGFDLKASYKVSGNFQFKKKKVRDTFFYSLLTAVLKKANQNLKQNKVPVPKFNQSFNKNKKQARNFAKASSIKRYNKN
jgi:ribosomal protein S2